MKTNYSSGEHHEPETETGNLHHVPETEQWGQNKESTNSLKIDWWKSQMLCQKFRVYFPGS